MKTIASILLELLMLILMSQSCYHKAAEIDVEADKDAIRELLEDYCDAVKKHDLERFLSYWEDDAIRMEAGFNTVQGKEQLREHFGSMFDIYYGEVKIYGEVRIEVYGDVAHGIGNYVLALTYIESDSTFYFDGKFLDVYRRQPDGSWMFYIDCVTSNPEVTKATMKPEPSDEEMIDPKF